MNPRVIIPILCFILCGHTLATAQDIDTELSNLTERLADKIQAKQMKKVAVIDFTDLQGGSSELGKYIAEQMTVDFVMTNRNFSVLDRANLKKILAEHKLTATGVIDPDTAKKLGMFAGLDAIIIGTIIPKGENIALTAKVITTETAEIVGADKARFKTDDTVKQLLAQVAAESNIGAGDSSSSAESSDNDAAKATKSFGDLHVSVQSLQIANGKQYVLTMTLANKSPKKTIWVAMSSDNVGVPKGTVTDPNGFEFQSTWDGVSGLAATMLQNGEAFCKATEIQPGDSVSATLKYFSRDGRSASLGQCQLQAEFLVGYDYVPGYGHCTTHNFLTKVGAE